jgi:hypothetical protein
VRTQKTRFGRGTERETKTCTEQQYVCSIADSDESGDIPFDGRQECTNWEWRHNTQRDPRFSLILAQADELNAFWNPGSGKDRKRTAEAQANPSTLEALMRMYETSGGPPRGPRKDLRNGPLPCQACQRSPCHKSCTSWKDLDVAMLCIGITKYFPMTPLPNAAREARKLHDKLNEIGPKSDRAVRQRCGRTCNQT